MNNNRMYLIQRGEIKDRAKTNRLSENVRFDYMGSAEFEWGALPESLRFMEAKLGKFRLIEIPEIRDGENNGLKVWTNLQGEEWESYKAQIVALRFGTLNEAGRPIRLKERSRFEKKLPYKSKTDFWWDIGNHVMWTFDKMVAKRLRVYLQNSFDYMNAGK